MQCNFCKKTITNESDRELIEYTDGTSEELCSRCYGQQAEAAWEYQEHYL